MTQDLRDAVRTLGRSPGFAGAAVLTLVIGLTGVISMFTLVNGVLLRPLPVRAERDLFVGWRGLPEVGTRRWPFTTADLALLRHESRVLAGVAGVGYNDPNPLPWADRDDTALVRTARVTGEFFRVLGAEPLLGRTLRSSDDVAGAENVVVIAHRLWRTRYGASPAVLGRRVTVGGQPFTIVGVMPRDVEHPRHVEAWMTVAAMRTTAPNPTFKEALALELDLLARVHPGVSAARAGEELRALGHELDALRPAGDRQGFVPTLQPYREFVVGDVRRPMLVLFAAVGLVLLIASANVSCLILVRGETRRAELAVRAALGAGRSRLIRQQLVEGVLLAVTADAVAVGASAALVPTLVAWVPDELPRGDAIRVDAVVALFALGAALAVTVLASLLPALAGVGPHLAGQLRETVRGSAAGGRQHWRRVLVAGQVALAVIGLVSAALLVSSVRRLQDEAARLASGELVAVPLTLPRPKYAARGAARRLVTELAAALEADPRVAGATPINATPFSGLGWDVPAFTAEGQSEDEVRSNPSLNLEEIHPGYFKTFDVALVGGRAFTEDDREGAPPVAIISADVAAHTWPGQDPVGKRVKWGGPGSRDPWLTIVGTAAPTRYRDLRSAQPTLYVPAQQMLGVAEQLAVRTSLPPSPLAELVRARVRALDPDVAVLPLRPFAQLLDVPLGRPRFYMALMSGFGATGVTLAVVGLYGVMAASVRHRRREIGVRIALGAEARHVRRLVLVDGAWLVGTGLLAGVAVAVLATQALRGLLYGVQPADPGAIASAVGVTLVVAAAALVLPMRAARRVDPAVVLRAE